MQLDAAPPRLTGMKMQLAAVAAAAACALAVGCGSIPASDAQGHDGRSAALTKAGPPTAAGNRKLAKAEAARLLAEAPLPAYAVRIGSAPPALSFPAMGLPEVRSEVDDSRSWRLPMSYRAAVGWLRTHRPAGLPLIGSSGAYVLSSSHTAGYGYGGPSSPAWGSAELDVEVAPARAGTSVLRADGVVVWLDPVPLVDTTPGPRLRVLASGRCPASDAGVAGVTNPGANLRQALVPAGRPRFGLTCTYYGANGRAWRLRAQHRLDGAQAVRLAASLQRISLSHEIGGVVNCPMDDGSAEVIALSYPGRPGVDLWQKLNGCGGVSNGYVTSALP
jgi:hypothetical protein